MKIEITHDIIAKKIFEKGSKEDKLFSKANRLVRERFEASKDTATYLTDKELEFIEPQYEALEATLTKEMFKFVKDSQRQQTARLYRKLAGFVLTGFIIGSLNKIWPWKEVLASEMINGKLKILKEKSVLPFDYQGEAQLGLALLLAAVGFIFIIFLEKMAKKKNA